MPEVFLSIEKNDLTHDDHFVAQIEWEDLIVRGRYDKSDTEIKTAFKLLSIKM